MEAADPCVERRPHQLDGANDIGLEEGFRVDHAATVVGFGGEVDDRIHGMRTDRCQYVIVVAYVAVNEHVAATLAGGHIVEAS